MEDKYMCEICMQTLVDPRLLDCLHIFCTKCLLARSLHVVIKTLSQDEGFSSLSPSSNTSESTDNINDVANELKRVTPQVIQCPTCGTETIITRGGVHNLPLYLKLQNQINHIKNKLPPCDLCSSSACAFTRCYECDIMMCGLCTDSHKEFRDTTFHTLIQLRTDIGRGSHSKLIQQVECKTHANQEANFYCWNCAELVCCSCSTGLHSGHKVDSVSLSATKVTDSLKQELVTVKPLIKQIALNADLVKYKINKVKNRCNDIEKEIEQFMQSYKEALENHWKSLRNEVETIKESRLEILQKTSEILEEKLKKGQTAIELAEDLIQDSSPTEALSIAKPILNRLQSYSEADTFRESKISECLKFLPDEKIISNKYQLFGIISTQSISSEHCTIQADDGLLSCRQHKKSSFILITRDSDDQPLAHGGEKIVAELRCKDAVQRVVPVFVKDEGNGTYTLTFVPDISGNMLLTVFIHNKHIKGSPYKVYVSSLRPHKGIFHCCAFCSSGGNKSATCGCNSKMSGGYNGCGHGHAGHPGRRHWSCCGNLLQNSECNQPIPYHLT